MPASVITGFTALGVIDGSSAVGLSQDDPANGARCLDRE